MEGAASVEFSGGWARAVFDDSSTTDHISPAGAIRATSPAGDYLRDHGFQDFNGYGAQRGKDEIMVRRTFANVPTRNLIVPGHRGRHHSASARRCPIAHPLEMRCQGMHPGTAVGPDRSVVT